MKNGKWKMENRPLLPKGVLPTSQKGDLQMLTEGVMAFLDQAAKEARTDLPDRNSSLFLSGVLDSFTLVDFVTLLESECNIKIDDADLRPENFDTIARVEDFIGRIRGPE
jgi:acyl carrier protein